jgi:branched-chain amino acid transport system ATP-binding protein
MSVVTLPAPTRAGGAIEVPLLHVQDLHAGFGSHAVLHGVDLDVRDGEIAGVFGLNGAGKSVTMKVLAGLIPAWSGRVEYAGRDMTNLPVEARVRLGIGNVPQGRQVFPELTVEQNLRLGAYQLRRRDMSRYPLVLGQVYDRFPVLAKRRSQLAGTMSGGEQASLAVARALMSEPRLVLVDEPSAGLAPKVVEQLFEVLADLNTEGLTILLVEQNVTFGLKLVHTAHLLRTGRVVYSGAVADLDRDRVVTELGIGRLLGGAQSRSAPIKERASSRQPSKQRGRSMSKVIQKPVVVEETEFQLVSGRVHAELSGDRAATLVIGVPGLSANLRSFDAIFEALDPARHRRLAYDPRGRSRSEKTPPGTYGWPAHAADIAEMADQLGAPTFDLVGWSMGTWIALKVCELFPGRVRRLVLIDGGGMPDESAKPPIYAGLERLSTVWPSRQGFLELVKQLPHYQPWNPAWERLFDYELEDVEGGVRARTSADAPREDEKYRQSQDPYALWDSVTMPSLLIRARQPILPGLGYIFNEADRDRFLREVAGSRAVEIDANHYLVGMNPDAAQAIAEFLDQG